MAKKKREAVVRAFEARAALERFEEVRDRAMGMRDDPDAWMLDLMSSFEEVRTACAQLVGSVVA